MLDRRRFLTATTASLAAAATWHPKVFAQIAQAPASLPDSSLYKSNQDAYWAELRKQFLIPENEVYLNNGTVGSSPAPVLRAIFDAYNTTERIGPAGSRGLSDLGLRRLEPVP